MTTIMYEVRQKISNHPILQDVERDVVVYRTADNMDVRQMPISAKIEHFKMIDGERILLPEFTREVKDWIVSNDYQIKQRDKQNQPILDEEGNEIKVNAFDAYQVLILKALEPILKQGILNDDSELKRFD
ncbi:hypothetical protein HX096_12610 [Empedobacter falsenii]|uniref:hypothetical protein n=1 Tax=Empedobacter falsenii TaxID=343874 RepID=UPI002579031F|nr:hypothetical protein [Empedobacter falsenii]MDM1548695.1 hypothetical protein [Empedobacter falsenii]